MAIGRDRHRRKSDARGRRPHGGRFARDRRSRRQPARRACARRRSRGSRRRWRSSATAPMPPRRGLRATRASASRSSCRAAPTPSWRTSPSRCGAPPTGSPASAASSTCCMSTCSIPRRSRGALESIPPSYHGVATVALDHPRVRAAIDDLAARGDRGRDAGVRRAELAPHPLCRHRQSGRRPHRRHADGPVPARTDRQRSASSRDRWRCATTPSGNSDSIRSSRASIRTSPPCRRSKGATTASVRARSPRQLLARAAGPRRHLQCRRRQPRHRGGAGSIRPRPRRRLDRA